MSDALYTLYITRYDFGISGRLCNWQSLWTLLHVPELECMWLWNAFHPRIKRICQVDRGITIRVKLSIFGS